MLKFLGLGRAQPSKEHVAGSNPRALAQQAVTSRPYTDTQRELVRVVLKDTLRQGGIPVAWLGCEVAALTNRSGEEELHVHLIILKWDDRLLAFLPAITTLLVAGLNRFEPSVDHSTYIMSWKFSPDCGCPNQALPIASTWTQQPPSKAAAAPEEKAKPKFDLPPSAWDRPRQAEKNPAPFAPTEPSKLV